MSSEMVQCPYNPVHRLLRKKLQSHLIKCKLSYPDVKLEKCPFNSSHQMRAEDLKEHVKTCPGRALILDFKYSTIPHKVEPEDPEPERTTKAGSDEECWDDIVVADYNPQKHTEAAKVIRSHIGGLPSTRKEFRKNERKRLGDESDESEEDAVPVPEFYVDTLPSGPHRRANESERSKRAQPYQSQNRSRISKRYESARPTYDDDYGSGAEGRSSSNQRADEDDNEALYSRRGNSSNNYSERRQSYNRY